MTDTLIDQGAFEKLRDLNVSRCYPIYLHGAPGRGKSYLCAYVYVRGQYRNGVTFLRYPDVVEAAIIASKNGYRSISDSIREPGLLIVDDLGVGSSNEWRNEIVWNLLEARQTKPTLLSGNLSPAELSEHFDERVQSRILAGSLMELTGPDRRIQWLDDKAETAKRVVKTVSKRSQP